MSFPKFGSLVFAFAGLVGAQGTPPVPPAANGGGSITFGGGNIGAAVVTGASYSGEQVAESVQILADGTRITRKMSGQNQKMYRDFAGRTRIERPMFPGIPPNAPNPYRDVVVAIIYDPVAGYRYTLDSVNHVAHRQKVQVFVPQASRNIAAAPAPRPAQVQTNAAPPPNADPKLRRTISQDSVGTQLINGVQAEGHRTIETIPAEAEGNDRPITVVTESWFSPELKLTVLNKRSDPRSGESTVQMLNLSRTEPDPSLFTVPPGFSIVDESGPFTIKFGTSRNAPQPTN